ncbi:MAG: WD40/YVTN/BNR-like repeat-containing protein [Candidatus Rokuibacteriota bacterium]
MQTRILIGTAEGLWSVGADGSVNPEALAGQPVIALAGTGTRTWAIVKGHSIWTTEGGDRWEEAVVIESWPATCLAPAASGLFIGTEQAHLLRFAGGRLEPVETFESVAGRETWYTPWGDPADVRSITVDPTGSFFVNVHVGGVVRSCDEGHTWSPTLDIEVDVHQVLAEVIRSGWVLTASAVGLGVSRDGGDSWDFVSAGLHARYLRAVAVSGETMLVAVSTGPGGRRSALYRRPLDGDAPFERCRVGLPEWFGDNIDTGCLGAGDHTVVAGTTDGRVFTSLDAGVTWGLAAKGLPEVHCVLVKGSHTA